MGLRDATETGPKRDTRLKCGACSWAATLDEADAQALELLAPLALSQEQGWNVMRLFEECKEDGLPVEYPRFLVHLKGKCSGVAR